MGNSLVFSLNRSHQEIRKEPGILRPMVATSFHEIGIHRRPGCAGRFTKSDIHNAAPRTPGAQPHTSGGTG
jgi:hypothetical protein